MKTIAVFLAIALLAAVLGACGAYDDRINPAANIQEIGSPTATPEENPLDGIEPEDIMQIDRYDFLQPPYMAIRTYAASEEIADKFKELSAAAMPSDMGRDGSRKRYSYRLRLFDGQEVALNLGPETVDLFADAGMSLPAEDGRTLWLEMNDRIPKEAGQTGYTVYNQTEQAISIMAPRLERATESGWESVEAQPGRSAGLPQTTEKSEIPETLDLGGVFPGLAAGVYRFSIDVHIQDRIETVSDIFELL
jgi:hypothetical protein